MISLLKKAKKSERTSTFSLLSVKNSKTLFELSEPYRNIRTNIEFSISDKEIKTIALTSTQPSEAKTTTALNLAVVFANKYPNVLVVDCDLRKPKLHKYLHVSNTTGLTNALKEFSMTGEAKEEFIQKVSRKNFSGNLSVLTCGKKVANPNELLSSSTFKNYVQELRKSYDYIIFDCPPILAVSDAIPVCNSSDGTLFVYSCSETKKQNAMSAITILEQNNVHILGTVLTKAKSYFNNYYYYSYND